MLFERLRAGRGLRGPGLRDSHRNRQSLGDLRILEARQIVVVRTDADNEHARVDRAGNGDGNKKPAIHSSMALNAMGSASVVLEDPHTRVCNAWRDFSKPVVLDKHRLRKPLIPATHSI